MDSLSSGELARELLEEATYAPNYRCNYSALGCEAKDEGRPGQAREEQTSYGSRR